MTFGPAVQGKGFRQRFCAGAHLVGTFIKTPTAHATEILGDVGFDFVVIDEEHAPIDRRATDTILLAARAAGIAGIVRVPDTGASLLSALDCGAAGVLIPHVASPERARNAVAQCRYRGGARGFSNSPRAGRYGKLTVWEHVDCNDAAVTVIAMIEDPEAIGCVEAIAQVEGLDGVFIGRGDLTVAMNATSMDAPSVRGAVERIALAARMAGKTVCAMASDLTDAKWLMDLGVTSFVVASDQGFMRRAATEALKDFKALAPQNGAFQPTGS